MSGSERMVHAMTTDDRPAWAARLQTEREARVGNKHKMARALLQAAGYEEKPKAVKSLVRQMLEWEKGKHYPRDWTAHYATALDIPEAELFEGGSITPSPTRPRELGPVNEALDLAAWVESSNVGAGTLTYISATIQTLTADAAHRSPLEVIAEAVGLQRRIVGLLRGGRQRLDQTQRLLTNAAELFALIGLLASDVGRYPIADAYGVAAWTCAEEVDSAMARAIVLSGQSKIARWEAKYVQAAEAARHGYEVCPPSSERVLLAAAEATALQSAGDIEGAWQAIRRAEEAHDGLSAEDPPATVWNCTRARLDTYAMQIGIGGSDPAAILRYAHAADEAWAEGTPWVYGTWAQVRIGAALAHTMRGDPEGAAEELAPVFDLEDRYRVVTIVGRASEVGRRLNDRRFAGSRPAQDLKERIRAFQAGSLAHRPLTLPSVETP